MFSNKLSRYLRIQINKHHQSLLKAKFELLRKYQGIYDKQSVFIVLISQLDSLYEIESSQNRNANVIQQG